MESQENTFKCIVCKSEVTTDEEIPCCEVGSICFNCDHDSQHCQYCEQGICTIEICERCLEKHCESKEDCDCVHVSVYNDPQLTEFTFLSKGKYDLAIFVQCEICDEKISLNGKLEEY